MSHFVLHVNNFAHEFGYTLFRLYDIDKGSYEWNDYFASGCQFGFKNTSDFKTQTPTYLTSKSII
jgi:hypothetical protein